MEVTVYGRRSGSNIRQQRKYDKTLRDVLKTYPYAKEVKSVLVETYLYMQTLPDDEARAKHIEQVEKGVGEDHLKFTKCVYHGRQILDLVLIFYL